MPKKPMSSDEVQAMKIKILEHALKLLAEKGFEGLTMRGVARSMGVVIGTLYGYYESKDALYLAVLTRGFERLYKKCVKARDEKKTPIERLKAIARSYVDFGLEEPHFYNIMFTWHVPKFQDYTQTTLEPAALHELETGMNVYDIVLTEMRKLGALLGETSEDELKFHCIYFWTTLHGYIAGMNNTLLNYMHEAPEILKERILETMFYIIDVELERMTES